MQNQKSKIENPKFLAPVVFVVPGDLHLTSAGLENHRAALWMVDEANQWIRPDFVQFIGDNVQHAAPAEFELFGDLCRRLKTPYYALVGDHDVHQDPQAERFRSFVGEPYAATSQGGFRFIRLNTLEHQPLGLSWDQILWFRGQLDAAAAAGERAIVFQHHYPFKVYEQFDGPGIDDWRGIVRSARIGAIFAGHTHYGQIANDGRNVAIATRSIGDPEGGPPGYTVGYVQGEDLAVAYRSIEDRGPLALITHPRELLLATGPEHIVSGTDELRVRVWSRESIASVQGRFFDGPWFPLEPRTDDRWSCPLPGDRMAKGQHVCDVRVADRFGAETTARLTFLVDPTGRYTPVPRTWPAVKATAFC
ncbi:MAG TPA: metallophosphoesterase [Pirellulales bacterium]|jgi:predicted phosphodiesterase|nr:metallophosphoesterase [Pirellulales bacterium]